MPSNTYTATRPLTTVTEDETVTLTPVVIDGADDLVCDIKSAVNGGDRLIGRFRITPTVTGSSVTFAVDFLDFSGSAAQTYVDRSSPFSDIEADRVVSLGSSPAISLHDIHNAAGDPTAS